MHLADVVSQAVKEHGLTLKADELGVSKVTLRYWMSNLHLETRRVVLKWGETITINRNETRGSKMTRNEKAAEERQKDNWRAPRQDPKEFAVLGGLRDLRGEKVALSC